jgi:Leucine-rich repeat (LRR) protein
MAANSLDLPDDIQTLMDGIIGEEYIQKVVGNQELSKISHLSIEIDTSRQSVYDLCVILPNLKHLVLDNSIIPSVRDLGIGLRYITSLSLSFCGLNDIDGIGVLTGLQELNLSDNQINDVTPLAMHENLQVSFDVLPWMLIACRIMIKFYLQLSFCSRCRP